MSKDVNARITKAFHANLDRALELSHDINRHPELGYEEHRTSAVLIDALLSLGDFRVDRGAGGLPTAFTASVGTGELVIGVCAEMDALPEIGHACGHNVIAGAAVAAAAVAAAAALAPFADELGVTVKVFGTPAEEMGTGKRQLLDRGVFDGTHAAMLVHPALKDMVTPEIRASRSWRVSFAGIGGHASRPWSALNAGDAVVVAQTAIGLLRQQLRDGIRVHVMTRGAGASVNVIPSTATVDCMIRGDSLEQVDEVWARVERCFAAGAVATGTTHEVEGLMSWPEFRHDPDLAELFTLHAQALGRTFPDYDDRMLGSTDMAEVSLRIPALHPVLSFGLAPDQGNHTAAFAAAAGAADGDAVVRDGGLAMALTIADAAASVPLRARLLGRS
ncbi:amidohydrolase [Amycolatopsis panacis]|uniref:Peptidase M20 domain-containing protein 2 n=1 Tax=Amycolatopsis panacis TaxID=2340917 RepID=A0A419I2N0_9PSEU|nr:amidohydrolase [Amycolatopsis panacis]RJQ84218.1 amidohydrolase [Amycolatopsis panacis]